MASFCHSVDIKGHMVGSLRICTSVIPIFLAILMCWWINKINHLSFSLWHLMCIPSINDSKTAPCSHLATLPVKSIQAETHRKLLFLHILCFCHIHRVLVCGSLNACPTQSGCLSHRNYNVREIKGETLERKKKAEWYKQKCEAVKESLITRFRKCYMTFALVWHVVGFVNNTY